MSAIKLTSSCSKKVIEPLLHRIINYLRNPHFYIHCDSLVKSSYRWCSLKKGAFKNFAKFTGKHLCRSLSFNKVAGSASLLCFVLT